MAYSEANVQLITSSNIHDLLQIPAQMPKIYLQKDVTLSLFKKNILPEWEHEGNKNAHIIEVIVDVKQLKLDNKQQKQLQQQYANQCQQLLYFFTCLALIMKDSVTGLYCKTKKSPDQNTYQIFFQLWCINKFKEIQTKVENIIVQLNADELISKAHTGQYVTCYQMQKKERKVEQAIKEYNRREREQSEQRKQQNQKLKRQK